MCGPPTVLFACLRLSTPPPLLLRVCTSPILFRAFVSDQLCIDMYIPCCNCRGAQRRASCAASSTLLLSFACFCPPPPLHDNNCLFKLQVSGIDASCAHGSNAIGIMVPTHPCTAGSMNYTATRGRRCMLCRCAWARVARPLRLALALGLHAVADAASQ
jgi:hypothetical protein